jgi:hypothetical protein
MSRQADCAVFAHDFSLPFISISCLDQFLQLSEFSSIQTSSSLPSLFDSGLSKILSLPAEDERLGTELFAAQQAALSIFSGNKSLPVSAGRGSYADGSEPPSLTAVWHGSFLFIRMLSGLFLKS